MEQTEEASDEHTVAEHTVHKSGKVADEEGCQSALCEIVLNVAAELVCLKVTGILYGYAENTAVKMLPEALEDCTDEGDIF